MIWILENITSATILIFRLLHRQRKLDRDLGIIRYNITLYIIVYLYFFQSNYNCL